jgi:hypothetical protein
MARSGAAWASPHPSRRLAPTRARRVSFKSVRYYRQRSVYVSGTTVLRRSEPSTVLTFTPVGTKNGATITKGADASGELSTHWEIEASLDNANFYRLARTINATTTYVDNTAGPKTYPTARGAGSPASTDGTGVTYVLLSNQAAQLNLTGTVSNGVYSDGTNIAGRGWIGYTQRMPTFHSTHRPRGRRAEVVCVAGRRDRARSERRRRHGAGLLEGRHAERSGRCMYLTIGARSF